MTDLRRSAPDASAPADPADQLLEDGQEEVFSRAEVEAGRIEHQTKAGNGSRPEAAPRWDQGSGADCSTGHTAIPASQTR